ncbi:MAG: H-NS family nucleoid-associated regulatory protein [Luteimonas sp.]
MSIDVNTLSAKELDTLISQAKRRKTTLKKRKPITTVRAKITALATAEGYTLAELFGGKPAKTAAATPAAAANALKPSVKKGRKLGKVAPKYRNPANTKETWTGRGKQPRWMAALTKKGKKPEDFLIKK